MTNDLDKIMLVVILDEEPMACCSPIKIEGNTLSPITFGGTSARAQASVLSLYDTSRFEGPVRIIAGKASEKLSWEEMDQAITSKLNAESQIRIVTNTILSPTTKKYPLYKHTNSCDFECKCRLV